VLTRALLAWEYGGARGHIAKLKQIAESLAGTCVFDAALSSLEFAGELAPYCEAVFQGPKLGVKRGTDRPLIRTGTVADSLPKIGFLDPTWTRENIEWWRAVIVNRRIGLVIGDCAPRALLAARSLGIPCAAVGNGYFVPPGGLEEFPSSTEPDDVSHSAALTILNSVNEALAAVGALGITRLPEIFSADIEIPITLPPLDPYRELRAGPTVPPNNYRPTKTGTRGDMVTAYLSSRERRSKEILGALRSLPVPVRCIAPGLSEMAVRMLTTETMEVVTQPLPPAELHDGTRLLLHSANHGTLCLGIAAGLAQVGVPQHKEQVSHGRRAATLGVLTAIERPELTEERLSETIMQAYEDGGMASRAVDLAAEMQPFLAQDPGQLLRDLLTPLLRPGRSASSVH
jgi:UDP:flavonoid glycosyltransferase YjiC (YdhE family)